MFILTKLILVPFDLEIITFRVLTVHFMHSTILDDFCIVNFVILSLSVWFQWIVVQVFAY